MIILVSEKYPRAKRSQAAQSEIREGSESSNCCCQGNLTEIPAPESPALSYGMAGHWQSSKGMTTRSSQAHRLSLESPRLGQTGTDWTRSCPHPSTTTPGPFQHGLALPTPGGAQEPSLSRSCCPGRDFLGAGSGSSQNEGVHLR